LGRRGCAWAQERREAECHGGGRAKAFAEQEARSCRAARGRARGQDGSSFARKKMLPKWLTPPVFRPALVHRSSLPFDPGQLRRSAPALRLCARRPRVSGVPARVPSSPPACRSHQYNGARRRVSSALDAQMLRRCSGCPAHTRSVVARSAGALGTETCYRGKGSPYPLRASTGPRPPLLWCPWVLRPLLRRARSARLRATPTLPSPAAALRTASTGSVRQRYDATRCFSTCRTSIRTWARSCAG